MSAFERLVVQMPPEDMERLEAYQHSEKFRSRSDAVRAIVRVFLDTQAGTERLEPAVQILEPRPPAYTRPGMLPGEDIPRLKWNRKDCHGLTPLVAQRLQRIIDDTRRQSFTEAEIAAAIFPPDHAPLPGDPLAIRDCMRDLGWQKSLIREGQPRGEPLTVYSAAIAE